MEKIRVIITNNQKAVKVPTGVRMLIRRCCHAVLRMEKFEDSAEISVTFVDNEQIRELNAQYRNKDAATDVLSFPMGENGVYDINHDTGLAVRYAQGGISDLSCLFAEDGAQESLFRGQLGLALRRYLADQNVGGVDFRTDADDTFFVQILKRVIADVRDVAGDFFRSELGVTRFGFIFFNVE